MRKVTFFLLFFTLFITCKKEDQKTTDPITQSSNLSFTSDSASTQPGMFFTIKSSILLKLDTITVTLDNKPILLTKIDSFHYTFLVPVLAHGTYLLDLSRVNAKNNLEINIKQYTPIANPDDYIASALGEFIDVYDSLFINTLHNKITAEDKAFINQGANQIKTLLTQCSPEQKLNIAYFFQNFKVNRSSLGKIDIDTAFLKQRSTQINDEPSRLIQAHAIQFEIQKLAAFASTGVWVISAAFLLANPINPAAAVLFIAATINARASISVALKTMEEEVSIIGVTMNDISEVNGNGTTLKPIIYQMGKNVLSAFIGYFRTIRKNDELDKIENAIVNSIQGAKELEKKDNESLSLFSNIKNKLSQYFSQISSTFNSFKSPVKDIADEKMELFDGNHISVSEISDPNLIVNIDKNGTNGVSISVDNPTKNITSEKDFSYKLTYSQEAISKKVAITQYAKFKPLIKPSITTAIVGSITSNSASSGGIITNDGGGDITSKGLFLTTISNPNPFADILNAIPSGAGSGSFVTNLTGLKPSTTYYVRAYAQNNAGLGFGNEINFKTLAEKIVLQSPANGTIFQISDLTTGVVHVTFTWTGPGKSIRLWIGGGNGFTLPVNGNTITIDLGSSPDWWWEISGDGGVSETGHFSVVY